MENNRRFCQMLRKRSQENCKAFDLLFEKKMFGSCISILRQELDSIVRVIYLLHQEDMSKRNTFIQQTLVGKKWSFVNSNGKRQNVTDRDMVNFADTLENWTENVYRFGCAFIHLSHFHDYMSIDPFQALSDTDKENIINQLNHYHFADLNKDSSFFELIEYLPHVMAKINGNLECYIKYLEEDRSMQ